MTQLLKRIEGLLAIASGIALFIMMILTFVDVVGRYGFNHSIFGTAEYIEYLMVVVIFAGVAFISAEDEHIKVEIFEPWIKKRIPRFQRWSVYVFSLFCYGVVAVQLFRHAIDSFESGKRSAVLDLPLWYMPAAAALFSIVGVLLFLVAIISTRGRVSTHAADGLKAPPSDPLA